MVDIISLDDIREKESDNYVTITYGDVEMTIPFRFRSCIEYIDMLQTRIEKLENELILVRRQIGYRQIDYKTAEKEIIVLIESWKNRGIRKISIIDIIEYLHLPPEQIETIMKNLEKRGIKEID